MLSLWLTVNMEGIMNVCKNCSSTHTENAGLKDLLLLLEVTGKVRQS